MQKGSIFNLVIYQKKLVIRNKSKTSGHFLHLHPPASCVVRDASGNMSDIMTENMTDGCAGLACNWGWNFTDCIQSESCEFGLSNSLKVQVTSVQIFCFLCSEFPDDDFFQPGAGPNFWFLLPHHCWCLCSQLVLCSWISHLRP